jgi:hypothetical protein
MQPGLIRIVVSYLKICLSSDELRDVPLLPFQIEIIVAGGRAYLLKGFCSARRKDSTRSAWYPCLLRSGN